MFLDEEIKVRTDKLSLHSPLKGIYKELIDSYEKGNDDMYYILMDELETSAKQAYLSKLISHEALKDLFHLVGIYD